MSDGADTAKRGTPKKKAASLLKPRTGFLDNPAMSGADQVVARSFIGQGAAAATAASATVPSPASPVPPGAIPAAFAAEQRDEAGAAPAPEPVALSAAASAPAAEAPVSESPIAEPAEALVSAPPEDGPEAAPMRPSNAPPRGEAPAAQSAPAPRADSPEVERLRHEVNADRPHGAGADFAAQPERDAFVEEFVPPVQQPRQAGAALTSAPDVASSASSAPAQEAGSATAEQLVVPAEVEAKNVPAESGRRARRIVRPHAALERSRSDSEIDLSMRINTWQTHPFRFTPQQIAALGRRAAEDSETSGRTLTAAHYVDAAMATCLPATLEEQLAKAEQYMRANGKPPEGRQSSYRVSPAVYDVVAPLANELKKVGRARTAYFIYAAVLGEFLDLLQREGPLKAAD